MLPHSQIYTRIIRVFFVYTVSLFACFTQANADTYLNTLYSSVESHDRVAAARADVDASRERIRVSRGAWFPEMEINAHQGYEALDKPAANTSLNINEVGLKITQQLWDFGVTNARVEQARLTHLRTELTLFQTRQDIMLEAVTAAIQVRRALRVVDFARQSEENVRRQTGLEEARVKSGGGLSTDVLQAKTQLAGAQARRIRSEGDRALSLNRYRAIFRTAPANISAMAILESVLSEIPNGLDEALRIAFQKNPRIRIASVDEVIAREVVRETQREEFLPRLNLVGETKISNNLSGALGRETGSSIKIQLSFPFNLGFTSVNTLRARQSEVAATSSRVLDTRRQVEESVRNAWQQYETARLTARSLHDQASLASAFLDLARKERQLGNRSLIDVLSGESALFNAMSDAVSIEADVLIAAFTLLHATGLLVAPSSTSLENDVASGAVQLSWTNQGQ